MMNIQNVAYDLCIQQEKRNTIEYQEEIWGNEEIKVFLFSLTFVFIAEMEKKLIFIS